MKSLKLGSSAGRIKTTTPTSDQDHSKNLSADDVNKLMLKPGFESNQKSLILRTRDDSSDEEEDQVSNRHTPLLGAPLPLLGHAPIPTHLFPGGYPPPPHMMPPRGPPPDQFYSSQGRGLVGSAPMMPPHSVGGAGKGMLPHQMPPSHMVSY